MLSRALRLCLESGGYLFSLWRVTQGCDEVVSFTLTRRTIVASIGAFLLTFVVLATVFALVGLSSVGWQLLAYFCGVAAFVWWMERGDRPDQRRQAKLEI